MSQDAALPCEEDPEAVQAPAAAGTAHLRRVVHVPAHQPGQDHQTPLQLRKRYGFPQREALSIHLTYHTFKLSKEDSGLLP